MGFPFRKQKTPPLFLAELQAICLICAAPGIYFRMPVFGAARNCFAKMSTFISVALKKLVKFLEESYKDDEGQVVFQ